MKKLWRKATELFWDYPVLWGPVLVAELAKFFFEFPRHWVAHAVVVRVVQQHHSVLSTTPDPPNAATVLWASLLSAPFTWGTYFVGICLYTVAFMMTAELVRMALRSERLNVAVAVGSLRGKILSVFGFSLKVFALYLIAALFSGPLLTALIKIIDPRVFPILDPYLAAFIVGSLIAYIVTPAAIRLVQTDGSLATGQRDKRDARSFAILAVLASALMSAFCQRAEYSLLGSGTHFYGPPRVVTELVAALLAAFPYIPLFVVLSLIAFQKSSAHDLVGADS